jgi:hypothetical protein
VSEENLFWLIFGSRRQRGRHNLAAAVEPPLISINASTQTAARGRHIHRFRGAAGPPAGNCHGAMAFDLRGCMYVGWLLVSGAALMGAIRNLSAAGLAALTTYRHTCRAPVRDPGPDKRMRAATSGAIPTSVDGLDQPPAFTMR